MIASKTNFIAYYRVSTAKQGASGLGLEAQRQSVIHFVKDGNLVAEYTEVESGRKNNRLELEKAIAHAKKAEATLVIAKLDRLSRNVAFIFALRDSGVDFVCADMPDANTLTIGIFAAMAQHERELISQRTKAALQAKKQQGHTLGSPQNLTVQAQKKGANVIANQARTNPHSKRISAIIQKLLEQQMPIPRIADFLNQSDFVTVRGKKFHGSTVRYLISVHLSSCSPV
jgi:DNA invertase Pin-like site-specific DNA recombinase